MEPQNEQEHPPPKPSISEYTPCSKEAEKRDNQANKYEETHQNHRNLDLALDLSLCRNDFDQGFDPKLDEIDRQNVDETHNSEINSQGSEGEPRVFSCNYCQRKFYSSQALGGHQNAHKRERTLAKRGQRLGSTTFGNYYPDHHHYLFKNRSLKSSSSSSSLSYPNNISSLPIYGSHNNNHINHKPLGIQAHSLIHKPSYSSPFSSTIISSHHGWSRMPMIDQQPAIGRLTVGSPGSSTSSNGGVARFGGIIQKNSQNLERNIIGGICWKGSVINSSSSISNKQEHDQLHKLDLSLKL